MYVFVRWLGCSPLVAAWAAVAYMVFPAHLARTEHASLLHFEVLALTLFAAAAAAARPSAVRLGLVGLAVLGAWLTSGYFGVMAAVGAVTLAVGIAVLVRAGRRARFVVGVTAPRSCGDSGCRRPVVDLGHLGARDPRARGTRPRRLWLAPTRTGCARAWERCPRRPPRRVLVDAPPRRQRVGERATTSASSRSSSRSAASRSCSAADGAYRRASSRPSRGSRASSSSRCSSPSRVRGARSVRGRRRGSCGRSCRRSACRRAGSR